MTARHRLRSPGAAVVALAVLALAGCAGVDLSSSVLGEPHHVPAFAFEADTFAFPNMIRARYPADTPGLYANYCFVLARAVRQFHDGARFDPEAAKLDAAGYAARVRAVVARPPWSGPLPAAERVVIPGYANLRDFSAGEERTVKSALGGRFWTWVHWTNWRVTFPVTGGQQAQVAREIVEEVADGRLVQLLVTNWPKPELNHTVVAFATREDPAGLRVDVWDPNDPAKPGIITFDRARGGFLATSLYDTEPGPIRAFRMYYSWWL